MLPIFKTDDLTVMLMQTKWKSEIDPVISLPVLNGNLLTDIDLILGTTIVNHKLSRKPQGWFITDINGAATVYRSQPFNDKNITLTASAAVTVNLWVF